MARESNFQPYLEPRPAKPQQKRTPAAEDAAKKAQRTEQKYDEKRGIFTK